MRIFGMRPSIYCISTDRQVRDALRAVAEDCNADFRPYGTVEDLLSNSEALTKFAVAECLVADDDALPAEALRTAGIAMPVVVIATGADPGDALRVLGPAGWAVVAAPVAPPALDAAVRRALDYDRWRRARAGDGGADHRARRPNLDDALRKASAVELSAQLLHELSQPLTAINAWAGACQRQVATTGGEAADALTETLDLLVGEARRATEILRAFRALSRHVEPERASVDMNASLIAMSELLADEALTNGIDMRLDLAPDLPAAVADGGFVDLALFILCRNAIEALAGCRNGVKILTLRSHAGENEIHVSISDTGPGLDEATVGRLFKPVASTKPNGVGVGLAACRSALEALGGRLWLELNTTDGASFAFALPLSG